jgi:hypothetical protein
MFILQLQLNLQGDLNMQTTNLIVTQSLIGQAEELAAEHEQFNEQYVVNGRKALYGLLEKIYNLAVQFEASPDKEDLYRLLKTDLSEKHGIRIQANTSNVAMLVRYITRAERKTAHVYARAIESAIQKKISSVTFEEYVEMLGGLEKIRIDGVEAPVKSPKMLVEEEKLNLSRKFLLARTLLPYASFKTPKAFTNLFNPKTEFEIVICRRIVDEYRVVGALHPSPENDQLALNHFANYMFKSGKSIEELRESIGKLEELAKKKREALLNPPKPDDVLVESELDVNVEQNTEVITA